MKKTFTHIRFSWRKLLGACAVALVLCACDWDNNFFYHPVEFRGEAEEEQMVVNAILEADSTPLIYLNRSVFFLNAANTEEVYFNAYYYNDLVYQPDASYTGYSIRRGYIKDATVEMRIDGGSWTALSCKQVMDSRQNTYSDMEYRTEAWAYVSDIVLRPGNTVEVRIAHKDYPKGASVKTVLPVRAGATAEADDMHIDRKPMLVPVRITLPPYEGNPTDVLCIRTRTYASTHDTIHHFTGLDPASGDSLWDRSETYDQQILSWPAAAYSREIGFARYDQINISLSQNYYGSHTSIGLYHDVNLSDAPITIEVEMPYYHENYRRSTYLDDRQLYYSSRTRTDSLVINVQTVNRDAYFYVSSMLQADYLRNDAYDYWQDSNPGGGFDLGDILDDIQDAFSEMGSMEGVQIYGNVKGAFGQMGGRTTDHIVIIGQ